MDRRSALAAGLTVIALLSTAATSVAVGEDRFTIDPNPVSIHSFFNGGTVRVRGTVDPGCSIVVVITGGTVDEHFNRKGRFGPLWATTGKVAISGVPSLHLVASQAPVATLVRRDDIEAYRLDVDALLRRARIDPDVPDRDLLLREYLKLKQQRGVVAVFDQAVRIEQAPTSRTFDAEIPWPVTAPTGTYRVAVLQVRERGVLRQDVRALDVQYVGIPRFVSYMAFERKFLYGLGSVVIALGFGLVIGLLFKKGPAGH
ncbi:MAG: TIGR02186 family protein [Acidobacteria bacterium]|nr:TIGR02186 family protein [Acidobacteriota bacterium]